MKFTKALIVQLNWLVKAIQGFKTTLKPVAINNLHNTHSYTRARIDALLQIAARNINL